jgi:hypothetical protein
LTMGLIYEKWIKSIFVATSPFFFPWCGLVSEGAEQYSNFEPTCVKKVQRNPTRTEFRGTRVLRFK